MKIRRLLLLAIYFIGIISIRGQQQTSLMLREAINMAWKNSNEVNLATSKVNSKRYELQATKNNQYPDLKISGQYQRLANASIDLKTSTTNSSTNSSQPTPVVNQLMLGQVSAGLPIFNGFKLKNSIIMSENLYEAENAKASQTKDEIAMEVILYYSNLYKSQKTLALLQENQKRAKQRITDFNEMEKNGLIPRNDLLKSQLQESNIELSIDATINAINNINYRLITLLKLPKDTKLVISEENLGDFRMDNIPTDDSSALKNRKDLEAIGFQEKASQSNIKIAKSAYYPSLSLVGGYIALDLKNVVTIQNAMNFGIGISYDLSDILKTGNSVKLAESKAREVHDSKEILIDNIKIQVQQAIEDYDLSLKQNVVYEQAADQATENYRIVKDKYDNGLSDTNDLLEADVDQLRTNINVALARANIAQKYYELLSASGQLSQTFKLSNL